MLHALNALFEKAHRGLRFAPVLKGTSTAMPAMTHGVALFGPTGRDPSPVELVPYRKIVGAEPVVLRVAHASHTSSKAGQSLAVFVHKSNPIEKLGVEELQRIFTTGHAQGEFSSWGQLGLPSEWSQRAIHTYGTPEYTGFGAYLQQAHFKGMNVKPTQHIYGNSGQITRAIAADPAAIGVASLAFQSADLKVVPIVDAQGRVSPGTPAEAAAGRYPLGRYLQFVVRREAGKPVDPLVKEYMRLVFSREGQQIVAADPEGYLPISAAEAAAQLEKLQ
jgi:phosphate transport system substrate-binding protein